MSKLLNMSLDDISKQNSNSSSGGRRGGRASGGTSGRNSPYARPSNPRTTSGSAADGKWEHDMFHGGDRAGRAGGRGGAGGIQSDRASAKLRIEGLHYEVTEAELKDLFEQIGPVKSGPTIKYDRSGRSTGVATVLYEDPRHASDAKTEYDGAKAKGQPIKISFEPFPVRQARGAQGGGDLLDRLGGGSSSARDARPPRDAPRGPGRDRQGPHRNVSGSEPRGGRGRRGGGGGGGGKGEKRAPKSANDLDAELDAFMKAPAPATKQMAESIHAPKPGPDGDIEMK